MPETIDRYVFLQVQPSLNRLHDRCVDALPTEGIAELCKKQVAGIASFSSQEVLPSRFQMLRDDLCVDKSRVRIE